MGSRAEAVGPKTKRGDVQDLAATKSRTHLRATEIQFQKDAYRRVDTKVWWTNKKQELSYQFHPTKVIIYL